MDTRKKQNNQRLFIGIYPAGIVYSDRHQEEHGDYKKLAFLPYETLKPRFYGICMCELAGEIMDHVREIQAKRGQLYKISACGQTVMLGGDSNPSDDYKKTGTTVYWPEMGDKKPQADGEVSLSHYGKHYFIRTPLKLPTSRSVKYLETYKAKDLVPTAQHKAGWHLYKATERGYEILKKSYSFSRKALLD